MTAIIFFLILKILFWIGVFAVGLYWMIFTEDGRSAAGWVLAFFLGIGGVILFFIAIGAGVVFVIFNIIKSFLGF